MKKVPLGEIAVIDREGVNPEDIQTGTLYVGLEHITSEGKFIDVASVKQGDLNSTKFRFHSGHVLYGKLRPYLKKIALPSFSGVCSTDILPIRPTRHVDRGYLFHFLRQQSIVDLATLKSTGINLPRLSPNRFKEFEVPLPPLSEQKRLAAILDRADDLRAKRRQALARLEALLQSVFLTMFGDPVRNPMGWEIKPFEEVCDTRLGKMLDSSQQTGKHLRPYLRNINVQWNCFKLDEILEMDFDEQDRIKFRLSYGDLLICEGGEVGRTAIWREQVKECYFQKALHRARPNPKLAISEYILFYMWFMAKNHGLKDHTTSATIAHLTGVKLKKIPVPLPPLKKQVDFQRAYWSVERLQLQISKSMHALDNLFHTLQQRAFRGELSTRDLEVPLLEEMAVTKARDAVIQPSLPGLEGG